MFWFKKKKKLRNGVYVALVTSHGRVREHAGAIVNGKGKVSFIVHPKELVLDLQLELWQEDEVVAKSPLTIDNMLLPITGFDHLNVDFEVEFNV